MAGLVCFVTNPVPRAGGEGIAPFAVPVSMVRCVILLMASALAHLPMGASVHLDGLGMTVLSHALLERGGQAVRSCVRVSRMECVIRYACPR